jgi:hypothetical protein
MTTILAEAGVRVTALTDDLRRDLRKDLNDAVKGVKLDTGPLQDLERAARRTNLELVKARDAAMKSAQEVTAAERALVEIRAKGDATAEELAAAERRVSLARAESAVAADKVVEAQQRLNSQTQQRIQLLRGEQAEEGRSRSSSELTTRVTLNLGRAVSALPGPFAAARAGSIIFGNSLKVMTVASVASLGSLGALAGAGGLLGVASAAAQAAGAVALLPAAYAFAAAGIATLTVGLQGLGEAFKNLDDPAKLAKSLEELSPAAREFVLAVKDLSPAARDLRLAVQDQLFAELGDDLQDIAQIYLPVLEGGLGRLARNFNQAAQSFAAFARQPRTTVDLAVFFRNAQLAGRDLAASLRPILEALRDIGTVGSDFLPGLAKGFRENAEAFADFIAKSRQSGELKQFIADSLASLKQFFGVLKNIGGIIGGVFRAGQDAGAGFLDTLTEITGSLKEFVNSDLGQSTLQSFFKAAQEAGRALAPILNELAVLVGQDLAPILADIATAVGPSVVTILRALGDAVQAARPGIEAFAKGFAAFLEGIAPALPALGELAGVLGGALGDALAELAPVLAEFVTELVAELKPVLPDLVRAFGDLVEVGLELLSALTPLIGPLTQLATIIFRTLADVGAELAPILADIAVDLAEVLGPILPDLAQAFGQLAAGIAPIAGPLGEALVNVLRAILPIIPPLVSLLSLVLKALEPIAWAISGLITLGAGLINAIGGLLAPIGDFVEGVGKFGVRFSEYILNGFEEPVRRLDATNLKGWTNNLQVTEESVGKIGVSVMRLTADRQQAARAMTAADTGYKISQEAWRRGLRGILTGVGDDTRKGVDNIVAAMRSGAARASAAGIATTRAYSDGIAVGTASARVRAANAAASVSGAFLSGVDDARSAGVRTAAAYADGVANQAARARAAQAAASLVQAVANFMPSSPAKMGPFSGRGWTPYRGAALVEGFAEGMLRELRTLSTAAGLAMETVSTGLTPGRITALSTPLPSGVLPQFRKSSYEELQAAIEAGVIIGFSRARVVVSARDVKSSVQAVERSDRSRG